MTKEECEKRIAEKIREAVAVLKEYEPESGYLAISYSEDKDDATIHAYNDAFRKDNIKVVDLWEENPDIKKTVVKTLSLDELPELHTLDEFLDMYDECVKQMALIVGAQFLVVAAVLRQKIREGFK